MGAELQWHSSDLLTAGMEYNDLMGVSIAWSEPPKSILIDGSEWKSFMIKFPNVGHDIWLDMLFLHSQKERFHWVPFCYKLDVVILDHKLGGHDKVAIKHVARKSLIPKQAMETPIRSLYSIPAVRRSLECHLNSAPIQGNSLNESDIYLASKKQNYYWKIVTFQMNNPNVCI